MLGGGGMSEQESSVFGGGGITEPDSTVLGGGGITEPDSAVLGGGGITEPDSTVLGGGVMREPLSVVVTTLNNADTLETCLASVAWADEIVLLDSGSVDATLEIAQKYGARIAQQEFQGYSAQKQSAIERASHAWVLLLDAR